MGRGVKPRGEGFAGVKRTVWVIIRRFFPLFAYSKDIGVRIVVNERSEPSIVYHALGFASPLG